MIQKNDFIEVEYTGRVKDGGLIFDTTNEHDAKIASLPKPLGPQVICLGHGQVLAGLEVKMVGMDIGKESTFILQPEEAFGKKSAKLVQLLPTSKFKQHDIVPQPGLQVDIDGVTGIVKTVSGGRTLVDFNHPLSGKVIEYKVRILRKVDRDEEKIKGLLRSSLGTQDIQVQASEGKATVTLKAELPKEIQDLLRQRAMDLVSSIKDIEFVKEPTVK